MLQAPAKVLLKVCQHGFGEAALATLGATEDENGVVGVKLAALVGGKDAQFHVVRRKRCGKCRRNHWMTLLSLR